MNTFMLRVQDATRCRDFDNVSAFVGEDASGSFGILAGHRRLMTTLVVGLARFRIQQQPWQYLAMPGAVLYFHGNRLTLSSRHFLLDDDYTRISHALQEQLLAEEEKLLDIKKGLQRMEEEVLKRLWNMGRRGDN